MRRLLGLPLRVEGLERLGGAGPVVIVANHASYLDGFVLMATVPGQACYVVKRELAGQFFARVLLKRLGAEFVERFDAQRGVEDTGRLLHVVRQGRAIVLLFPRAR